MGIDIEKIKARLDKLNSDGGDTRRWKPTLDKTSLIRLVPPTSDEPLEDLHFHYLDNRGYLCPKRNFNEDCPVCDFASKLWREGKDKDDDSIKNAAKQLFVRQRFFANVIDREEENPSVKIWAFSRGVYETILKMFLDEDYGDITDLKNGHDLKVEYTKPGGKRYPETTVTPRPQKTPFLPGKSSKEIKELLSASPVLMDLYERVSSNDMKRVLDEYLSDDESAESGSEEISTASSESEIEKAFSELKSDA